MRPAGPMPNFMMHMVQQGQQPQLTTSRRVGTGEMRQSMPMGSQQQMSPTGGCAWRCPTRCRMPDPGMHSVGAVMPSPYEIRAMPIRDDGVSQPVSIGDLATVLANA